MEAEDSGLGEVPLEVLEEADVGAAPGVQRLRGIADDHQVAVALGEESEHLVLRGGHVLELIAQDVTVAVLVEPEEPRLGCAKSLSGRVSIWA